MKTYRLELTDAEMGLMMQQLQGRQMALSKELMRQTNLVATIERQARGEPRELRGGSAVTTPGSLPGVAGSTPAPATNRTMTGQGGGGGPG